MTFRPSDDVLDEIANSQQAWVSLEQYYNELSQWDGQQQIFHKSEGVDDESTVDNSSLNSANDTILDIIGEEVKAPDLSELLQEHWGNNVDFSEWENTWTGNNFSIDLSDVEVKEPVAQQTSGEWTEENVNKVNQQTSQPASLNDADGLIPGKLSDVERAKIVWEIDGSVHSNLDFLVDKEWSSIVDKYKNIHRIVFRWGVFIFAVIAWVLAWVLCQVNAGESDSFEVVSESSISKWWWIEESTEKVLDSLKDKWVETIVSYGTAKIDWNLFQTKGNLISYKWITLPQLASIDYRKEIFSLDKFKLKETTREDLRNLLDDLVFKDSIYQRTNKLSNNVKWHWQTFKWGLIDWFSLGCLGSDKVFDVVCDRFVDIFGEYGKYYDLSKYSSELLTVTRYLKSEKKDIKPICDMVMEYTWRSWVISSDGLKSVMEICWEEKCEGWKNCKYLEDYNKLIWFIEIENSLGNPELSDKVFDDPDLNAYKLLSSMQKMYNFLKVKQINENLTDSYLKFVQALIDKDRWTNKYIGALYKDLVYVFNSDELVNVLNASQQGVTAQKISTFRSQIDQINNGNSLYGHQRLLSMLTTPDIVKVDVVGTWQDNEELTIDDLFLEFWSMNDRLSIRRAEHMSDTKLRVQTEIYSDPILAKTDGNTLKATVILSRKNNALYVDEIKISSQPAFSDVLNIYAKNGWVTFKGMLVYIDEQVWFHYVEEPEFVDGPNLCEELWDIVDVALYVCDGSKISLYKWDIEYNFELSNGILQSFTIDDSALDSKIRSQLTSIIFTESNTPTIITSIVGFEVGGQSDDSIEKKMNVIDDFRIHFKIVPNVYDIPWEDNIFRVEFSLWEFDLEWRYNVETHMLTRISYVACDKTLEIRNLSIEISVNNEAHLTEILNNPRMFLTKANQTAFRKYQKMCDEEK